MIFKFKNKKLIKIVLMLEAVLIPSVLVFWMVLGTVWTSLDWRILDLFYAQAVQYGYGPPRSSQIVYVTIPDDSYTQFGTHVLDRAAMARVNEALAQLGPAAGRVQPIFVSVDPARDTAKELQDYVNDFDPRILPLRGTGDQLARAAKSFGVAFFKVPGSGPDDYTIAHSAILTLVGPEGAHVEFEVTQGPKGLQASNVVAI